MWLASCKSVLAVVEVVVGGCFLCSLIAASVQSEMAAQLPFPGVEIQMFFSFATKCSL